MVTELLTHLLTFAVQALLLLLVAWLARRGRYPRLDPPDPEQAPTRGDHWRYRASVTLALGFGALAAWGLASLPPRAAPPHLARCAAYEEPLGPWLGAGFFGLACAALVAYPLAARCVAPGPLQHLLVASGSPWSCLWRGTGGVPDPRPLTRATARIVLVMALFLHHSMRDQHVTLTDDAVVWHDWPWQGETRVPWREVTAVEIVDSFEAMTGTVRQIPTLRLRLRDNEPLVLGRFAQRKRSEWERFGSIAAQCAGVALGRAPR